MLDTIAFRLLSQLATVLGYVVLVRGMSEREFGVFNLLYSFIPVVGTVLSLGLEQVLQRYQPEYLRDGNKNAAAWLMRTIASMRLGANVVMLVVVMLTWGYIAPLFKLTPYRAEFALFGILVLIHFQSSILQLALGSHMMHRYAVGSMTLLAVLKLIAYSILYGLHRLTLETAIIADMFGYGCAYLVMRTVYKTKCLDTEEKKPYRPAPPERKRLIRYGLLNNFNDAGVFLLYSTLDNFFIAAYLDTLSVGIYAFYSRLRQMVVNVLPAKLFQNIIRPLFFSIPSERAQRDIPRYFSFLFNTNLLVQVPALAFAIAYHAELVQAVFAGKFIGQSWMLPVLMAFATINAMDDPVSLVAQYDEKVGILLASKLFAAYNILAMVVMVPFLGIFGAALASGTAQTLKNVFIWWHVRERARWINARASLLWSVGLWGAAIAACNGLKFLIPAPAPVSLAVGALIFVVTGLAYFRTPALSASDREILASVVPEKTAAVLRIAGVLRQ